MKTRIRSLLSLIGAAVLTSPAAGQDFVYTANNGTITITRYIGAGGNVEIPAAMDGLPVSSIGERAFVRCKTLTSVTVPDTINSIGNRTFEECSSLRSVTLGNSVTEIGEWAFHYCIQLPIIRIPGSVTRIANYAFFHCATMTNIAVDASNPVYSSLDGILFDKTHKTLIQCPGGRTGSYDVADGVTSIALYAFSWCMGLKSITLPDSVTSIGDGAFAICGNLASITLPSKLPSIGSIAFGQCTNLAYITIPNSVTNIGAQAFMSCFGLRGVFFYGDAPAVSTNTFQNTMTATVYHLAGAAGWGTTYGGRPTSVWVLPNPIILSKTVGIRTNAFGFRVSWGTNASIVVDASTELSHWLPLSTNDLTDGWTDFSDPGSAHYPYRFYRIRQGNRW